MPDVCILVEPFHADCQPGLSRQMVSALKRAILQRGIPPIPTPEECPNLLEKSSPSLAIQTWMVNDRSTLIQVDLAGDEWKLHNSKPVAGSLSIGDSSDRVWCTLTLNVPEDLVFPGKAIYQTCREVVSLRQWVEHHLESRSGSGSLWLPIVLSARGILYGEAIQTVSASAPQTEPHYQQPFHLPDEQRQQLYALGYRLLRSLSAPPATYLLQFGLDGQTVIFDRLLPFPASPAIASIDTQTPDLFECYWCCLTNQPILDLQVIPKNNPSDDYSSSD